MLLILALRLFPTLLDGDLLEDVGVIAIHCTSLVRDTAPLIIIWGL